MNTSNPAHGTEIIFHDTGGDYRLRIGSTSNAEVGIGWCIFNQARVATDLEVIGNVDLQKFNG